MPYQQYYCCSSLSAPLSFSVSIPSEFSGNVFTDTPLLVFNFHLICLLKHFNKDGLNGTYDFRFLSSVQFLLFLLFVLLGTIPGLTKFHLRVYVAGCIALVFINPRRACAARVTVVVLCVCVCVCVYDYSRTTGYEAAYERYQQLQCYKGKKNNVAILLKRLRSRDMA